MKRRKRRSIRRLKARFMLGKPTALEDVLDRPRLERFIVRRSFEGCMHGGYVMRR